MKIIDTHAHVQDVNYPVGSAVYVDAEQMVAAMDRYGIDQMWISPCSGMVNDFQEHNKKQYEQFKLRYPARFLNYAVFNPYYPQRMREEFRRCFEEYGFEAIKVHSWVQGFPLHQPCMYEIMEAAQRYGVPVMFHDGTPPYADTLQIAALAERYPEVQVVLGHAGLYDSYRAAIEACRTLPNVWLCLIGPIVGDLRRILAEAPGERLLFGTDYCCAGAGPVGETLIPDRLEAVRLSCPDEALLQRILSQNAARLLACAARSR